ncbi:MAG: cytochrome c [Chromatiales bacterium]|jgi:cytochrome c556
MKKNRNNSSNQRVSLALAASLVLGLAAPVVSAGEVERAVEYRQGLMNVIGWNVKSMGAMMKGETPYDQAAFARHAADVAKAAQLDLLAGFPEDSVNDESDALSEIWFDFDDFSQKFHDFQKAADSLDKAAASGDKAATQAAFKDLGESCKSCHKKYKN